MPNLYCINQITDQSIMKKFYLVLTIVAVIMTACQQTPKPAPVDIEAEKAAVNEIIENMYSAMKAQDVETLLSFYTEDMIGLGSDPSEMWNKQQITDIWKQMLADTSPEFNSFGDRFIKVAVDGNSAIAVDQYFMPMFTDKIPFRNAYHLVKKDGKWIILFFNVAFIPKNEDIPKLNAALE